jgi:hypothetical protein
MRTSGAVARAAFLFGVVFAIGFLGASAVEAQGRRGGGGGAMQALHYDKTKEMTVTGTVDEVLPRQGRVGGSGTHVRLKTDSGMVDVHLGPSNWLENQKYEFAKGDALEVTGSRTTIDGVDSLIAREVRKGQTTMTLRNEQGMPAWAGRGRAGGAK